MASTSAKELQHQHDYLYQNRNGDIITSNVIMLTAAYVALALRFVSRRLMRTTFGADDWMMVVGLFFTTCFVAGCLVCVSLGMGRHSILIKRPIAFAQAVLTTEALYTPASTSIKFSVLLLYRRIFPNRKLKIASWCITGILVIFALAQMLSVIIQCTPPAALWDPFSYPDAVCDNYVPALTIFAVINAVTDITVLCLPLPILWHLQVNKTRRRQLIGMFLLGGLVCLVSICRAGYVHQVSLTDPSWDDINTVILSAVENCAGVISGCLPTLLPIWQILRHGRSATSKQQSGHSSTPRKRGETKLLSLRAPFWPKNGPREVETGVNGTLGGSFKRLSGSVNEEHSMKNIISSAPTESMPRGGANTIRITTDLRQTGMAVPHNDMQSGKPSEW